MPNSNGETTENITQHFSNVLDALGKYSQIVDTALTASSKERFVANLEITKLLSEMRETAERTHALALGKVAFVHEINNIRRQVEEVKALKLVNGEIIGKNEAERGAAMTVALSNDGEYLALQAGLDGKTQQVDLYEVDLEHLRTMTAAMKYEARLKAAQLEYLSE